MTTTLDDIEQALDSMKYDDGDTVSTSFKDSIMVLMRNLHRLPDTVNALYGQLDMTWLRRDRDDYVLTIDFQEDANIVMELIDESAMKYSPRIDEDMEEYSNHMHDADKDLSIIGADNAFNPEPYNITIDGFDNGDTVLAYDDSHEHIEPMMMIEPGSELYDTIMKAIEDEDYRQERREQLHRDFNDIIDGEVDDDES